MVDRLLIVIPAYHGAASIDRSLRSIGRQLFDRTSDFGADDVSVVVAVNDEGDRTADAARIGVERLARQGIRARVIRTPRGRVAAITAAETGAEPGCHRLYLDQDAVLSPDAVSKIASAFAQGDGVCFAAPAVRFSHSPSAGVRSFLRYWLALPYVTASPVTCGAYAVSAAGRFRWSALPDVPSEDKYVRLLFEPAERRLVDASYEVVPPDRWIALVRDRARYIVGSRAVDRVGRGDAVVRYRTALAPLRHPARWPDFIIFLLTYIAAGAFALVRK